MAKYGSNLKQIIRTKLSDVSLSKEIEYAYVTDVATNTNNPELEGAIKTLLPETSDESEWIFPINYHTRIVPTKGELVVLYPKDARGVRYYGPAINIHNYPTHNAISIDVQKTVDYIEPDYVNPYKLFTGDYLLEGRFGQSIRFSQTLPTKNVWSEGKSQGNSVIVISSGQRKTSDSSLLIEEDLDNDAAVLVLLENGKLKYNEATQYEGNQALLISDRVHIKSREENVSLTANKNIELEDEKWKATVTQILDIIEELAQGGNATANGNTLPFINILELKLKALRKSL